VLHQADIETIKGIANYIKQYPNLSATVEGKTDKVGTKEYNEHLSEKRANAVVEALLHRNGIAASRVTVHWAGENRPNVPTADEQAELQNRVVMVTIR
jgi:OOP family OmpA-OmpF porin